MRVASLPLSGLFLLRLSSMINRPILMAGSALVQGVMGLFVHEAGHIGLAAALGLRPRMHISRTRLTTKYDPAQTPLADAVVTMAGPATQTLYSGLVMANRGTMVAATSSLLTLARHVAPLESADVTHVMPIADFNRSRWVLYVASATLFLVVSIVRKCPSMIVVNLLNYDLCVRATIKLSQKLHGRVRRIQI